MTNKCAYCHRRGVKVVVTRGNERFNLCVKHRKVKLK
jgi:hypothetical protein